MFSPFFKRDFGKKCRKYTIVFDDRMVAESTASGSTHRSRIGLSQNEVDEDDEIAWLEARLGVRKSSKTGPISGIGVD